MAESIEPKPLANPSMFPTFRSFALSRRRRRRQVQAVIAAAALPDNVTQLIVLMVKRTRLWRREQLAVARELIAHFQDGLDAGEAATTLVQRFGNPAHAAVLIRRAKKRNRPLLWHLWKYTVRGTLIMLGLLALFAARFLLSQPTVKVDYINELNKATLETRENSRAWPIYRRALIALGLGKDRDKSLDDHYMKDTDGEGGKELTDLTPADSDWPIAAKWLDAHAEGLSLLRQAAAKPNFGFILGRGGSQRDPELGWNYSQDRPEAQSPEPLLDGMLISVLLPALSQMRESAHLLRLDLRDAQAKHDAARAVADFDAMLNIAAQQRDPILITRLVAIGIDAIAIDQIQDSLRTDPAFFSDAELIALAHRVSRVGGDSPSSLLDLSAERMFFYDIVQRSFTDDGHGDGYLTARGAKVWQSVMNVNAHDQLTELGTLAATGAVSMLCSRQPLVAEYERLMNLMESRYRRPLRETSGPSSPAVEYDRRILEIQDTPLLMMRYFPIAVLMPSLDRAGATAERLLGRREGLEVGIALELYHRRHGQYPASLDELAPALLPALPVDRINGEPLKYRIIQNRPVVYSVGVDRDDDGGAMAKFNSGKPDAAAAASWDFAEQNNHTLDGDWILFDGRPTVPTTQPSK